MHANVRAFILGVLVGAVAVYAAVYFSGAGLVGRYQFSTDGTGGVIIDTRTGEYWEESGSHFDPRHGKIEARTPEVIDRTRR